MEPFVRRVGALQKARNDYVSEDGLDQYSLHAQEIPSPSTLYYSSVITLL